MILFFLSMVMDFSSSHSTLGQGFWDSGVILVYPTLKKCNSFVSNGIIWVNSDVLTIHFLSTKWNTYVQEVGTSSTRGGSRGKVDYICLCKKANKAEPTLVLKPGGDVPRNPKTGVQVPPPPKKKICVRQKSKNPKNLRPPSTCTSHSWRCSALLLSSRTLTNLPYMPDGQV